MAPDLRRELYLLARHLRLLLAGLLGSDVLGYGVARVCIFHSVERYAGLEGKGPPRQDLITRLDRLPGEGWEYRVFLPAIKLDEAIDGFGRNR